MAVVTVAAGGLPIVESTVGGTPVTEATNGRGVPVTKVVGKPGMPVVYETIGTSGGASAPPLDAFTTGLTGAWSMSRKLLTSYGGSFYTDTSGTVSTLFDQSGAGRNFVQGSGIRPLVATQGGIVVADLTPNVHQMTTTAAMNQFITASAGYIVVVVYMDAHVSTQSVVWRDGVVATQVSVLTSTAQMSAYNDDGAADSAAGAATVVSPPNGYVMTWRHEGGVIYANLNGGTDVSVASGNTTNLTGGFIFGRITSYGFDGKFYEAYMWNTVPSAGDRAAIIAQAKTLLGI